MNLKFECSSCQVNLLAEPEHYGQKLNCPECSELIQVPHPKPKALVEPEDNDVVKFLCPFCSRRLSALSHQFGKEMPCPHQDCLKPVMVPRPEWKPIPTTLIKHGSPDVNDLVKQAEEMTKKKPD